MVFSSLVFISIFLPAVMILYWLLPSVRCRNFLLLAFSLLFYAYGEPVYVFLMIVSAFFNYICAWMMQCMDRYRRLILTAAVCINLGMLAVFKYAAFFTESLNAITGLSIPVVQVALPVGISFFTFQAMSYVIDVYRKEVQAQRNFVHILLYISLFPQLIAGPIVKYHDIESEIMSRSCSTREAALGIRRFIAGLGKKVLIANYMGVIADTLFASPLEHINIFGAWLGAAAYMLQIYFDFSGYSDMAIGIGWMFGFHFKENFNYPYRSVSIRDFWRRWHISLSGWFREYLYIPLGGNRRGKARTCMNKLIVFAATGLWHGANVTFLFWGLYHGMLLMIEEYVPLFRRECSGWKKIFGHLYVVLAVMIGFVFFRADSLSQGVCWVYKMFAGMQFGHAAMQLVLSLLTPVHLAAFAAGMIASGPLMKRSGQAKAVEGALWPLSIALLLVCMMNLAGSTYNPFIYFRF